MEKKIAKERKLNRHDVGREAFVSEVSLVLNSFTFYWFLTPSKISVLLALIST